MKRWFFSFWLIGSTAICTAAPLNKTWLPADTRWVLHLDLDALRNSKLGVLIQTELESKYNQKIKALEEWLGSNLLTDIHNFTLYGPDSQEQNTVVLAAGQFQSSKLIALLMFNPQYQETTYGPYTLYEWMAEQHGKKQIGTFARQNLIVISQNQQSLQQALDVLDGKLPPLSEAPWLIGSGQVPAEPILMAAADGVPKFTNAHPQAALLANAQMLFFFLWEKDSTIQTNLFLRMPDPQTALHVQQAVLGMKAILTLSQNTPSSLQENSVQTNPDPVPAVAQHLSALLAILNHCQVDTDQNTVTIHFEMPSESVYETFNQWKAAMTPQKDRQQTPTENQTSEADQTKTQK